MSLVSNWNRYKDMREHSHSSLGHRTPVESQEESKGW